MIIPLACYTHYYRVDISYDHAFLTFIVPLYLCTMPEIITYGINLISVLQLTLRAIFSSSIQKEYFIAVHVVAAV